MIHRLGGQNRGQQERVGQVWLPVNHLLMEALQHYHRYYGDDFRVEYPHRPGDL